MNNPKIKTGLLKEVAAAAALGMAMTAAAQAEDLTLAGKRIGVAVVGTQHFWDREAFTGAVETVEKLGGEAVPVDGGRDNQVHADNHDILLAGKVDAVISILGDGAVEPKFEALEAAGIPVFTVDHPILVVGLNVSPFLATLGTFFKGASTVTRRAKPNT